MKKTMIALLALTMAVLVNSSALAQHKLEYNPFEKDAEQVGKIEQQWANAILSRDSSALQGILTDDYSVVSPDGKTLTKSAELALVQSEEFKLDALSVADLKVRVYSGGAVVTGRVIVKGKAKDSDLSGEYRFTDIFEPRKGVWQAVARQLTKVEDDQGGGKKKSN